MKNTFDARKRNLGTDPSGEKGPWLRRLIVISSATIVLVAAVATVVAWHSMTHVTTVAASVSAAMVNLATDIDAHMAEMYVSPGQVVKKGDVLARLDDSSLRASLAAAKAEKAIKESMLGQAKADHQLAKIRVESDIQLAGGRVEIAEARVERLETETALRKERVPVEIRRAKALCDEAEARLDQLKKGARKERIEAAKARLATSEARAALSAYQVEQIRKLVERQVESELELEVMKTDLEAKRNEMREAQLQLDQLMAGPTPDEIAEAEQALEAREASLALAQTGEKETAMLEGDLAIRKAELRQARAESQRAEAQRVEIEAVAERVKAAEAELQKAAAEVEGTEAALKKMAVVAPVSGTIIRTFERPGEICRKGVTTILMADDSAGRWIEGYVLADDARLVEVGQTAEVEVGISSRQNVRATVAAIGLSTAAIGREESDAPGRRGNTVWVKLKTDETVTRLPGEQARATINVR